MWDQFWESNFFAAFFGAVAGGGATYWFGVRNERRRELVDEIRSTDAARALAFNVVERAIQLNYQHVRELVGRYRLRREVVGAHRLDVEEGRLPLDAGIPIGLDLKRLDPLIVPAERLETMVLEHISIGGRRAQLAVTILQAWKSLNESIKQLSEQVVFFRTWEGSEGDKAYRFYGYPYEGTHRDTTFQDIIEAMGRQTDDLAWFGRKLVCELEQHADGLRRQFREEWFLGILNRVVPAKFDAAEAQGLFPPDAGYAEWERGFTHQLQPTGGRWKRLKYWHRRNYRAVTRKGSSARVSRSNRRT
jgi:hypothetical protein